MTKIKIFTIAIGATLLLSGCSTFGFGDSARKTFKYEKSPCACMEEGTYFNGKFYPRKTV